MRILGIDPGLATTGWGVITQGARDRRLSYIAHGAILTSPGPLPERLLVIEQELDALLTRFQPDCVAIEELFFAKNAKTAMVVAQARGVIVAAVARKHLPVREFTPLEIKLAITSSGRAEKRQVQLMTQRILGLQVLGGGDDACDALAAAICAANTLEIK